MPELPEVEVVRAGLQPWVEGRRIADAAILHPRVTRHNDLSPATIEARLVGARIEAVSRRGKFMWWVLDDGDAMVIHLGMSGQMLVTERAQTSNPSIARRSPALTDPRTSPHLRSWVRLGDGTTVWFVDQRTFGYWRLDARIPVSDSAEQIPSSLSHIARDLLDPRIDLSFCAHQIKASSRMIKAVLLEQTIVSGIGNIYADEMLWLAGLSGARRASAIGLTRLVNLLRAGQFVMRRALEQGGTSFDSLYVNVNGASGYFARSLNVYGRRGAPCPRCGSLIKKKVIAGRGSYYCPSCQR